MLETRDIGWWYWLGVVLALTVGVAGWRPALYVAVAIGVAQLAHYLAARRDPFAFPVQVRFFYLAMLVAGLWPPLRFIYWLQLAGTWVRVLTGYCFLARSVSLLPWNRREAISRSLLTRTFLTPPRPGSIMEHRAEEGGAP